MTKMTWMTKVTKSDRIYRNYRKMTALTATDKNPKKQKMTKEWQKMTRFEVSYKTNDRKWQKKNVAIYQQIAKITVNQEQQLDF